MHMTRPACTRRASNTQAAGRQVARWAGALCLLLPVIAHAAATREEFILALNAPLTMAECEKRLPSTKAPLAIGYAAWLEKQSSEIKDMQAKIGQLLKDGPKDAATSAYLDKIRTLPLDELTDQCQALTDLFAGKQEEADPRRQDACSTWRLFAEALGRQDLKTARKMVSGVAAETLASITRNAKPEHFTSWAENIGDCSPGIKFGAFQEVHVVTKKNRASAVTLTWTGKNWTIVSM